MFSNSDVPSVEEHTPVIYNHLSAVLLCSDGADFFFFPFSDTYAPRIFLGNTVDHFWKGVRVNEAESIFSILAVDDSEIAALVFFVCVED